MPQPTAYVRDFDFSEFQEQYSTQPLPASEIDAQLDAAASSISQTINRLGLIQRDDGYLQNKSVKVETLSNEVKALLGSTIDPKGVWVTGTDYEKMDLISSGDASYLAVSDHTSAASFQTDLDAGKWILFTNAIGDSDSSYFQKFSGNASDTEFTLSNDLGEDENAVMAFYDAGGTEGYQILAPTDFSISGTTLTITPAPALGTNNIFIFAPSLLVGSANAAAVAAAASAVTASAHKDDAEAAKTAAELAETNAETAETGAQAAESAAQGHANTAATLLESIPYRDPVFLTFADSPYTMLSTDNGKFFQIDTSGGAFVFNARSINGNTPMNVTLKKATSDANTVTFTPDGSDTGSKVISSVGGAVFIADDDTVDQWVHSSFGSGAGEYKEQEFSSSGGFVAGTTTALTITETPIPPSAASVLCFFDGLAQHPDTYSYDPATGIVTHDTAIPLSTKDVYYYWQSSSLPVGTPSDGTVSFAKMASGALGVLADAVAGTISKIMTMSVFKAWVDGYGRKKVYSGTIASLDTEHDITSVFRDGYNYEIVFQFEVSTQGVAFLRFSNDNGATFNSGGSDYQWKNIYGNTGVTGAQDGADTEMHLAAYSSQTSAPSFGKIRVLDPLGSKPTMVISEMGGQSTTNMFFTHMVGHVVFAEDIDAMRIGLLTGAFAEGVVTVYEEPI